MPAQYLILRQTADGSTVTFYDSDAQRFETLFAGKRWAARRFILELRQQTAWKHLPAFNEKAGRNGHAGTCVEIPFGKL